MDSVVLTNNEKLADEFFQHIAIQDGYDPRHCYAVMWNTMCWLDDNEGIYFTTNWACDICPKTPNEALQEIWIILEREKHENKTHH